MDAKQCTIVKHTAVTIKAMNSNWYDTANYPHHHFFQQVLLSTIYPLL